jgi:hypothetical protein
MSRSLKSSLQSALILLLLNRHAKDVRGALQERDVMLAEFAFRPAIHLEHAIWNAVALQNDIHGPADSVSGEQFRSSKPFFIFEMIGNHGLTGLQGVARRRIQVGSNRCVADHTFVPADAGANKETLVCREVLQDFAVFGVQAFGRHPGSVVEQIGEARALQGQDPKFGEQLLLPNACPEHAAGRIFGFAVGFPFNEGGVCVRCRAHTAS